jgi:hypothetical protein
VINEYYRAAYAVPKTAGQGRRDLNDHSEAIDRIKALVLQALGISSDVMAIFDDTKRNLPDSGQTGDSVAAWLTIYTLNRAPLDLDLGDLALVRRVAQFGVKCQLSGVWLV